MTLQICFTKTSLKHMVIVILFPGIIHIICVFVLLPKKAELEKRTIVQVVYLEDDLKNQA